jgi:hypothetical protein
MPKMAPDGARGGFLTPKRRSELEALLVIATEQMETAPPLLRLRLERSRDLVVLMLKAEGPGGTPEDRRELYARMRPEFAGEPWPGPKPSRATELRHARAEKFARRVCLTWIGHPAVSREVAAAKPALMDLVDDLNLLPPGWIDRDAAKMGHVATHTSRHGRTADFMADLNAAGEFLVSRFANR